MNKYIGNAKINGVKCSNLTLKRNCREIKKKCPVTSISDKETKQVIIEKIKEFNNPRECYYFLRELRELIKGR